MFFLQKRNSEGRLPLSSSETRDWLLGFLLSLLSRIRDEQWSFRDSVYIQGRRQRCSVKPCLDPWLREQMQCFKVIYLVESCVRVRELFAIYSGGEEVVFCLHRTNILV